LGSGFVANRLRTYRSFEHARNFARSLGLKSEKEWKKFCGGHLPEKGTPPSDIPANPNQTYANKGWVSMGDWLGTGIVAPNLRHYKSFKKARAFARGLGLNNRNEWNLFCKGSLPDKGTLPPDIPANPNQTYADKGWSGVGDWLGTGYVANFRREYRPFHKARAFARKLGLKSENEWREFSKGNLLERGALPSDIPANPREIYSANGWAGIGDWLGTGRTRVSKSPKRKS
jgi:hypothetical protein